METKERKIIADTYKKTLEHYRCLRDSLQARDKRKESRKTKSQSLIHQVIPSKSGSGEKRRKENLWR